VAAVLVDFQGLKRGFATKLRREFRRAGVEYKVCEEQPDPPRAEDSPVKAIVGSLERGTLRTQHKSLIGMTGVAWLQREEPVGGRQGHRGVQRRRGPAGREAQREGRHPGIPGAGKREWVEKEMAKLPGLKETQAAILDTMMPLRSRCHRPQRPAQNLVFALQAWVKKLEEQGA